MRRRDTVALGSVVVAGAAYLTLVGLQALWTLRSFTYDMVIFDQGIRGYSRLEAPVAVSRGVHSGQGPDASLLADHFSPVLALLGPLYLVHDGPVTLVVAQALLLSAAAVPLWFLARRELGAVAAHLVAVAYVASWPLARAAAFDVHEAAFAPLVTAILLERWTAWRLGAAPLGHVLAAATAVLLVKEDMGLLLAGFGAAVLLTGLLPGAGTRRRSRRVQALLGVGLVLGGLAWTVVMTAAVLPALGGHLGEYWRYDSLGETPGAAARALLADPGEALVRLVSPEIKLGTWMMLLAVPVGVVASPVVVMILPLLAARLLSDTATWWSTSYHYDAFLVVPLLAAGVDAARRLGAVVPGRARLVGTAWAAVTAGVACGLLPQWTDTAALTREGWTRDAGAAAGARAAAEVPDGVLVEASNHLGPQLTRRTTVLLLDRVPRGAPWVVVDTGTPAYPFCGSGLPTGRVAALRAEGYEVVAKHGDWVVLHDPSAVPDLEGPRPPPCP